MASVSQNNCARKTIFFSHLSVFSGVYSEEFFMVFFCLKIFFWPQITQTLTYVLGMNPLDE